MESGVRFLAIIIPQMLGVVVTGGLVTQWGHYVSFSSKHNLTIF